MNATRVPWFFGVIFGGAGLIVLTIGWWMAIAQHYRLATYLPVKARIIRSHVASHVGSKGGTTYEPVIHYAYTVQGRPYQGDRVLAMGTFSSSGNWAWRICWLYPAGAKATAWYSPQDPASVFLSREAQFIPHLLALFGIPFAAVGAWALFQNLHGRRRTKPPGPRADGWFVLAEQGTIGGRFWFYAVMSLLWYAYFMAVIGDYLAVNQHRLDLFALIAAAIGVGVGIVWLVLLVRYWRLSHDFLDAEVCAQNPQFCLGQTIQLRLRQGVRRPLRIDELSLGAVCMRSDRTKSGGSVNYSTSEDKSIWTKLEVNRAYTSGGQLSANGHLGLPPDAQASSPPRSEDYPFFQWFIGLRVTTEGQPELKVYFPIVVEAGG